MTPLTQDLEDNNRTCRRNIERVLDAEGGNFYQVITLMHYLRTNASQFIAEDQGSRLGVLDLDITFTPACCFHTIDSDTLRFQGLDRFQS